MEREEYSLAIHTPFIRLDQLLKYADIVSTGGDAKELIAEGLFSLNGETVFERGKKVYPGDVVGVLTEEGEADIYVTAASKEDEEA